MKNRLWLACVGILAFAAPAASWGPVAHRIVVREAIDTLPGDLKNFYKNNRQELPTLGFEFEEEQPAPEGPERRFAVDRLMPFPFLDLPRSEAKLGERYAGAADGLGRLPWLTQESYASLVAAFRAGDKTRILEESDRLAGYVADLHNPLALTDNADGEKTSQHGVWTRFTVKFPEVIEGDLKLRADAAHYLDRPDEFVFSLIEANYVWVDNLLYQEGLAHRSGGGYTTGYYDMLRLRAQDIVGGRLSEAIEHVGSYWYSAWTDAGRPELAR